MPGKLICYLEGDKTLVTPEGERVVLSLPVYGGARYLIEQGYDPETIVEYWRGDTICFLPAKLQEYAKFDVRDVADGRRIHPDYC